MPHGPYIETTVHTAKCTPCGERNKAVLRRCTTCSWAICTPCYEQRGGDLRHGTDLQVPRQPQTSSTSAPAATVAPAFPSASYNPPTSSTIESTGGIRGSSAAQVAQIPPPEHGILSRTSVVPAQNESQIQIPRRQSKTRVSSSLKGKGRTPTTKTTRPSRADETTEDDDNDDQYLPRPTRSGRATGCQMEKTAGDDTDSSLTELSDSLFPTGSPYKARAPRSVPSGPAVQQTGWASVLATSNEERTDQSFSDPDSAMAREYRRRIAMAQDLGLANFPPANTLLETREQSYDLRAEAVNVQESGIRESLRLDWMMRNLPLDGVADMETRIQRITPAVRRVGTERDADTSGQMPSEERARRSPAGRSLAIPGSSETQSAAQRLYPTWYRRETQHLPPSQRLNIPPDSGFNSINCPTDSVDHSPRATSTKSTTQSLRTQDPATITINHAAFEQEATAVHTTQAVGASGSGRQASLVHDVPVRSGSNAEGLEGIREVARRPAGSGVRDACSSRSGNDYEMDEEW